jgi:hypothetical protein
MPQIREPVVLYSVPSGRISKAYFQVNPEDYFEVVSVLYLENP